MKEIGKFSEQSHGFIKFLGFYAGTRAVSSIVGGLLYRGLMLYIFYWILKCGGCFGGIK